MTGQLTMDQALEQRDRALQAVEQHADEGWKERALAAVRLTCLTHAEWHVDRVWEAGLDTPRESRAMGPILRAAAKRGWCEKTDRVLPSVRSHGSGKSVWRSLIYQGRAAA